LSYATYQAASPDHLHLEDTTHTTSLQSLNFMPLMVQAILYKLP